ncbi:MAG: RNA polymerase sigma factor [Oscillospiraceae bacterium]|nr:RNA polymerase sigma factor [Oscillospiraceae bacterium]
MEDQQIIELFWNRDDGAIPAAQEKYGGRLLRLAERLAGSREDGEECVNDTFLNAWNAIPPERPRLLFAWLAKVCRNLAFDRLDWKKAEKRSGEVVALTAELESCVPDGLREREAAGRELGELLTAFLETQPETARLVFLRRYWYGDSIREIGERYGYGESKVKVTLLRTRERLRAYLEKEGITV